MGFRFYWYCHKGKASRGNTVTNILSKKIWIEGKNFYFASEKVWFWRWFRSWMDGRAEVACLFVKWPVLIINQSGNWKLFQNFDTFDEDSDCFEHLKTISTIYYDERNVIFVWNDFWLKTRIRKKSLLRNAWNHNLKLFLPIGVNGGINFLQK
jgi:hypothetical protein